MKSHEERKELWIPNPYKPGEQVNVQPLMKLLNEHNEKFSEDLCSGFRKLLLVAMREGEQWIPELELLNDVVSMIVETKRDVTL